MDSEHNRFIVFTGGPGAGKTSLIDALAKTGLVVMPEAGRAIIRREQAKDGSALPWRDPARFADAMLDEDIRSYARAEAIGGDILFDRGIVDVIGYRRLTGLPIPDRLTEAAARHRYANTVFIAPFWPEIFEQDSERRQDLAEAERTCRMMEAVYAAFGYTLVPLPLASVSERVAFVLGHLHG